MRSVRPLAIAVVLAITAAACATTTAVGTSTIRRDEAPMTIALTTNSAEARSEFLRGVRALDVERVVIARQHFDRAVAADRDFAFAHLYAAITAPGVVEYRGHLDEAVRLADRASEAERLRIRAERMGIDSDVNGQLALAQQLVRVTPNDPRAWTYLAGVQFNAGQRAEARASLERAGQSDPNLASTWTQLGNSYLLSEPRDVTRAETYFRRAMALDPNAPYVHDYMGDLHRAQNNLPLARAAYTRMIELDPSLAIGFQQRGHVNSFLGNFAEARADYDRAIALADPTSKPGYAVWRALVSVYEGNPAAAEAELDRVVASVDAMAIPNAMGSKIFAFSEQARIALHTRRFDVAQRAIDQMRPILRQQANDGRSDAFRRFNEATIAYWEGMLAARRGDFAAARTRAQEMMAHVAADRDPRKNERAHELLGMADLLEGKHESAAGHFAEANPDNVSVVYHRALALEGAGRSAEARELFRRVAAWNFNNADVALLKKEAARKAG